MKKEILQRVKGMAMGMGLAVMSAWLVAGCASTGGGGDTRFSDPPADLFPTNAVGDGAANGGVSAIKPEGDRLRAGDRVTVKFSGTTDQNLQTHEQVIKDDGTITLPYIQDVKAAGKNLGELQKEIHDRYVPDYYKRLTVIVTGEQRVYYVGGQVKTPGRQMYLDATTVTKAIQSAGDFTDFAAKTRVQLTRADGKKLTVDCEKARKDPSLDLPVYPGDTIHVPQRGPLDFFR